MQLLAYYAHKPPEMDVAAIKAARLRHILFLIERDPKDGFGLFQVVTGVYSLHCQGDDLADPDGYQQAASVWREQIKKNSKVEEIKKTAAGFLQFCSPEEAEQLLIATNDSAGLGNLYASAILGITGKAYETGDAVASDPALRQSPFAEKASRELQQTADEGVLVQGTTQLFRQGGIVCCAR